MNRFLLQLIIFSLSTITFCASTVVDATVARVGSHIILQSDVQAAEVSGGFSNTAAALDALIEMALVEKLAENDGISVSDSDVQRALDTMAQQRGIKKSQIPSDEKYLDQVKKSLLRVKLIQAKVVPGITVTDAQIRDAYQAQYGVSEKNQQLRVEQVFIGVDDYPNPKELADKIASIATKWPEDLAEMAPKSEIAELGTFKKGDLTPAYEKVIFSTPVGKISRPLPADDGYHLFFIKEKIKVAPTPLEKVKKDLHNKILDDRVESAYKRYIENAKHTSSVEKIKK